MNQIGGLRSTGMNELGGMTHLTDAGPSGPADSKDEPVE